MRPVSFAAIGECMIELSGGASDRWQMGFAGDTFNTAWYVRAALPARRRVAYVTALGDDPFSARLHDFIAEAGIETDRIRTVRGRRPGLYAITLEAAERSFTYWRGESAARCLADDAAWLRRATAGAEMLYFSGITLAILAPPARKRLMTAIAAARKGGATVAFDPNYRPALWPDKKTARAAIEAAFHVSDIALPTLADAEALFGARQWRRLVDRLTAGPDARELVVKNGDRPAVVFGDGKHGEVPHRPAKRLVDTTGAGDSFSGGYLAGRLTGLDPFRSAKLGHAVASEVVGGHGALVKVHGARLLDAASKDRD
jgi:2-dehydro-3-deoxygluconokinase